MRRLSGSLPPQGDVVDVLSETDLQSQPSLDASLSVFEPVFSKEEAIFAYRVAVQSLIALVPTRLDFKFTDLLELEVIGILFVKNTRHITDHD